MSWSISITLKIFALVVDPLIFQVSGGKVTSILACGL